MTTDTVAPLLDPPAIPDSDLEPLLGDREWVCDGYNNVGGPTLATCRWVRCEDRAEWILHATFPCGHWPPITLHFCDFHKRGDSGCNWPMSDGLNCNRRVVVRWIEAIR